MGVCAGARHVPRDATVGKDSSQEQEEEDGQTVGDHHPHPPTHSHSVEGASLPRSLYNVPRGFLTPFPLPPHLPSEPL